MIANRPIEQSGFAGRSTPLRWVDFRNAPGGSYNLPKGWWDVITFKIETEREDDGRWLAEVLELPGVLAYGDSQELAVSKVQALALRVIAERLEHGEAGPDLLTISFNAA